MKLSALIERRGGVFLFRGSDGVEKYIENRYRDKEYIGWLVWTPETLELLKMLNPKCYVETGDKVRPYIICTGIRVAEAVKDTCKFMLNNNGAQETSFSWALEMVGVSR